MSTPRADLYGPTAEGGHYWRHIWSVGVAALWTCLERAMAVLHCGHPCKDPNLWEFAHLEAH
eukprot:2381483-Prymnesium_polylepis.1